MSDAETELKALLKDAVMLRTEHRGYVDYEAIFMSYDKVQEAAHYYKQLTGNGINTNHNGMFHSFGLRDYPQHNETMGQDFFDKYSSEALDVFHSKHDNIEPIPEHVSLKAYKHHGFSPTDPDVPEHVRSENLRDEDLWNKTEEARELRPNFFAYTDPYTAAWNRLRAHVGKQAADDAFIGCTKIIEEYLGADFLAKHPDCVPALQSYATNLMNAVVNYQGGEHEDAPKYYRDMGEQGDIQFNYRAKSAERPLWTELMCAEVGTFTAKQMMRRLENEVSAATQRHFGVKLESQEHSYF